MTDAERVEVLALAYALLDGSPWFRAGGEWHDEESQCALMAFNAAFTELSPRGIDYNPDSDYEQLRRLVESGLPDQACGHRRRLPEYNDAPGRRKRDVLRLYERAARKIGR